MSTENESTETNIDPTSDSFGADDAQAATGNEEADTASAEEWGEDKPEGDDDQDDEAGEGDDEDEGEEGDKPESHRVPISRLQKEVAKRRALAAELAELKAKVDQIAAPKQEQEPAQSAADPLAVLRKTDPEIAQIEAWIAQHDPEKINPDDFATQGEYQRAVTAAIAKQAQGNVALQSKWNAHQMAQANKASQAQAAEVAYFEKLGARYDAAISASKIPGAATYAKNIATRANQLAPEIQRAILEHPEPDVIAAALGSSREAFAEFAAASKKGVTSATMMRLGEVVASYKAGMSRRSEDPTPAPRKPLEPPRRRPSGGDPTRSEDRGGILSVGHEPLSKMKKELGLY